MNITPEEVELKKATWWVLQKIKKELDKNKESDAIRFRIQILSSDPKAPPPDKQWRALWNLGKNEKALRFTKSVQQGTITPIIGVDEYEITVSRKKVYETYRRLAEELKHETTLVTPQENEQKPAQLTPSSWEEGLKRRFTFNARVELDEAIFFRWVADYVKFVLESQPLRKIVEKDINEEETRDHKKLNSLKAKVQKELEGTALRLRYAIQKHKISPSASLRSAIDEYNGFKNGRIISSRHTQLNEHGALKEILRALFEEEYTDIVKNFAKIHTSSQPAPTTLKVEENEKVEVHAKDPRITSSYIEEYTFSPTIVELQDEIKYLEEQRQHTIWGSWRELYLAYLVIQKRREVWSEITTSSNPLLALDFGVLFDEMKEILEKQSKLGREHGFVQFKKGNYILHINRIHNYLLEKLEGLEKEKITQEKQILTDVIPHRLIIKDANGNYLYDGKKIEVGHRTIYYKVFDILFTQGDQGGFVSYEDIEKGLREAGYQEIEDVEERNKRILNAHQNLFRFAKVNGKPLQNSVPDGRELIEKARGQGLKLNNPAM